MPASANEIVCRRRAVSIGALKRSAARSDKHLTNCRIVTSASRMVASAAAPEAAQQKSDQRQGGDRAGPRTRVDPSNPRR